MFDMPPYVVVIACIMSFSPEQDMNSDWTGYEQYEPAIIDGQIHCKREKITLYEVGDLGNPSAGIPPTDGYGEITRQPFNPHLCSRNSILLIPRWNEMHKSTRYRVWRVACPTPVYNSGADGIEGNRDDELIDWAEPDCGTYGVHPNDVPVICEKEFGI